MQLSTEQLRKLLYLHHLRFLSNQFETGLLLVTHRWCRNRASYAELAISYYEVTYRRLGSTWLSQELFNWFDISAYISVYGSVSVWEAETSTWQINKDNEYINWTIIILSQFQPNF